jgi:hypothetical protein
MVSLLELVSLLAVLCNFIAVELFIVLLLFATLSSS